jgi:hypothetical protein
VVVVIGGESGLFFILEVRGVVVDIGGEMVVFVEIGGERGLWLILEGRGGCG